MILDLRILRTSNLPITDIDGLGGDINTHYHQYEKKIDKDDLLDFIFMLNKKFESEIIVSREGDMVYLEIYDDYRE